MRSKKAKLRFFVLVAGVCGFSGIAFPDTLPPIWFPAAGTPITAWSDQASGIGLYTLNFPFEFNFLGQNYTSAILSSNGSIYFSPPPTTPPTAPQPQASPNLFTQGSWPRIAPAWYNIQDIEGSGSVLVDTLSNQVVITFLDVASYVPPVGSVAPSDLATFQVSLDRDGSVIFAYSVLNAVGTANTLVGSQKAMVGITSGMGAPDPGSLDLSVLARTPGYIYKTTDSTVYQAISNNPSDNSNLAGLDLIFTPQPGLTWQVTSDFPGDPAPEPATLFEITLALATLFVWRIRKGNPLRWRI